MPTNKKNTANKNQDDAVFDVAKPGKSAPSESSRPILVSQRAMLQDPMVKEDKEIKSSTEILPPEGLVGKAASIEPLSNSNKSEEKNTDTDDKPSSVPTLTTQDTTESDDSTTSTDTKSKDDAASKIEVSSKESEAKKTSTDIESKDSGTTKDSSPETSEDNQQPQPESIVDELARQATSSKQKQKEDKSQAEREVKNNKLIADKTYNVPIGQLTHRKNTILFIVGLFLLLAGAAVAAIFILEIDLL